MSLTLLAGVATSSPDLGQALAGVDWLTLFAQVLPAISAIVLALLGWLSHRASALVAEKIRDERLRAALTRLSAEAFTAVARVEQTYVAAIRERSQDGKLAPEEATEAKELALAQLRGLLGPEGVETLMRVLGLDLVGLRDRLETAIEAQLLTLKRVLPRQQ